MQEIRGSRAPFAADRSVFGFLAQKELEVKELRLQLVEKEQDLSTLSAEGQVH